MNKGQINKLNEWIDAQTYAAESGTRGDFLSADEVKEYLPDAISKILADTPSVRSAESDDPVVMPIQPIRTDKHGRDRFVPNRIVQNILRASLFDMNSIATMDVTDQERMQFAQLTAYSVEGFGELGYVDDETFEAVTKEPDESELDVRNKHLRKTIDEVKNSVRDLTCGLFAIHPDDLN